MKRLLLLAPLAFLGCGGHGGGLGLPSSTTVVGKGRATLRIKWPARSNARMIPASANALTVNLVHGDAGVSRTIARPFDGSTTNTSISGLEYGEYTVTVRAFPNADGSGVAQAAGTGTMTVTEDVPGVASVSLASTVARLVVSPALALKGGAMPMTVSAQDASGAIVPIPDEAVAWSVADPGVATVSGTGPMATLTGVAPGQTTVHASMAVDDAGDRALGAASATVVADAAGLISIAPTSSVVLWNYIVASQGSYPNITSYITYLGKNPSTIQFTAKLADALEGTAVNWSVSGGGSIDGNGLYHPAEGSLIPGRPNQPSTAPPVPNVTVTASSALDPNIKATQQVFYREVFNWK